MDNQSLLTALGPLAELYQDTTITEIMVDGPQKVYVQREGMMADADIRLAGDDALRALIERLLALRGLSLAPRQTAVDLRLADGTRLVAALPPLAVDHAYLILYRRPSRRLTWEDLIEFGAVTHEALEFLRSALTGRQRLLIAGGFNSGKTTVANLVAGEIPGDKRVVLAERMTEMFIEHPRLVRLEAGADSGLSLPELLDLAGRLRPDWLVVGELQGAEALAALQALRVTPGGLTTIHATSTADALTQLEGFCLMANMGLGLAEVRGLIAAALPLVSYQEQLPTGRRRITAITAIEGVVDGRYQLRPLFRYNWDSHVLEAVGAA